MQFTQLFFVKKTFFNFTRICSSDKPKSLLLLKAYMYNFLVEHSVYVVLITTVMVFGGFILFLWRLDSKVTMLEKNFDRLHNSNQE